MLLMTASLGVIVEIMPAEVVIMITAAVTADSVTRMSHGRLLLNQVIQITHGTCISKMGMCTATISLSITMFVVSGGRAR